MRCRPFAWIGMFCALVPTALSAAGEASIPQQTGALVSERLDLPLLFGEVTVEIDRDVYRRIVHDGRAQVVDFPIPGRPALDLELERFHLLTPDARLVLVDHHGEHELPLRDVHFFRGRVSGDPDSQVTLTLSEGRIAGSIRTWDGEYIVEPDDFNPDRTPTRGARVRERRPSRGNAPFSCDSESLPQPPREPDRQTTATVEERGATRYASARPMRQSSRDTVSALAIDGDTLLEGTIAIDATREFFQHFGSLSATQDYILNLMAQVSTIYEYEVKVQLRVNYLRVFSAEPDPYTDGSTDTSVLLDDLRNEWRNNQGSVSRTATHLLSVRPGGGAGLAYVDVLCNTNSGYGVSTLSANGGAWEKELVAHEIGHNFSSRHTHCYAPEIDRCATANGCFQGTTEQTVGTIMSYCNQSVPVFHQRVKDEKIRPAAESAFPSCIDSAGLPGAILGGPAAGLQLSKPASCPVDYQLDDDGATNSYYGSTGSGQMAWVKRFTPSCYPFRITAIDAIFGHSSVAPGRSIRLLVFADPSGSGTPATSTLVHSEDVSVQLVSSATFNSYTLSDAVVISEGDSYVGFYDLVADSETNYIASRDTSREGDSYSSGNSTSPESFGPHGGGTWMIRAGGGAVLPGTVKLSWDAACNETTTVGQDYAVYSGTIGNYTDYSNMTCSTSRSTGYLTSDGGDATYFLVVPSTSANEGSYGLGQAGAERPQATDACKVQNAETCL